MTELYTKNDKKSNSRTAELFLKYFPNEIFGSECKNDYYHTKERLYALKEFKWIKYNSDDRFRVLSIDIDDCSDTMKYQDYNLPAPTWIIQTDKGYQYHWALKQDIPMRVASRKSIKLAKDIQYKLVALLGGDLNALGLCRVYRNPCNNRTWFTGNEIELKEFYDLPVPAVDKIIKNIKVQKDIFGNAYKKEYDFKTMATGTGRNNALFDTLRTWAYDEAKTGSYSDFGLLRKAEILNFEFQEPLPQKEINTIVNSIDRFIENKFNKGYFMALTPEQRSKVASENAKKSAEKRSKLAETKILTALNMMESFEMKITIRELAKRSGTNKDTVQKYLKKINYKAKV